ncbi:hypothetical protein B2J93_2952 [Marssonina coronariae]|uniref:Uncharacterized protein n=1 Tax=Diplocarpon coronariae TaxID=2795749 RepID=A0A218Z9I2_9HELO|nr:hypothetical protein B2J93_2952 [Marssonina coronariae]
MSFNQVIKKKITGTAIKDGSRITLSVATTTTHWTRPDSAVAEVGTLLSRSVAAWQEQLPQDTTEVCSRETDHTSRTDAREHLTVVCFNTTGEGTTRHLPVSREPARPPSPEGQTCRKE